MSHDLFMQAVATYEEAIKQRDSGSFASAVALFVQSQKQLADLEIPPGFKIAFFYDMALAYDLNGERERAHELFRQSLMFYDRLSGSDQRDPALENFAGLIWGIKDHLSLWDDAPPETADNYIDAITVRRWPKERLPLAVYIDDSVATGFDTELRDVIFAGFAAWNDKLHAPLCMRVDSAEGCAVSVLRVFDELGSSGGHTAFDEANGPDQAPYLERATIRIALPDHSGSVLNNAKLRALQSLAIHEAGHALGLDGHSPYASDLMYWKSPLLKLSERDANTLKLVYNESLCRPSKNLSGGGGEGNA